MQESTWFRKKTMVNYGAGVKTLTHHCGDLGLLPSRGIQSLSVCRCTPTGLSEHLQRGGWLPWVKWGGVWHHMTSCLNLQKSSRIGHSKIGEKRLLASKVIKKCVNGKWGEPEKLWKRKSISKNLYLNWILLKAVPRKKCKGLCPLLFFQWKSRRSHFLVFRWLILMNSRCQMRSYEQRACACAGSMRARVRLCVGVIMRVGVRVGIRKPEKLEAQLSF